MAECDENMCFAKLARQVIEYKKQVGGMGTDLSVEECDNIRQILYQRQSDAAASTTSLDGSYAGNEYDSYAPVKVRSPTKTFESGQQVEVNYNTKVFSGKISVIHGDGTYSVEYEDDDGCMKEVYTTQEQIRPVGLILESATPSTKSTANSITPSVDSGSPSDSLSASNLQDKFDKDAISQGHDSLWLALERPDLQPPQTGLANPKSITEVNCFACAGIQNSKAVQHSDPTLSGLVTAKASFVFRQRVCFDETMQRLACKINWTGRMPTVISVKPGGEADRRGILPGDSIAFFNDTNSFGKTRDELLPILQKRPLVLELNRSMPTDSKHFHVEVSAEFNVPDDLGMDISWSGSLPMVCAVQKGSAAWKAGVFVGDAIYSINALQATGTRLSTIIALQQRPLTLTLWRRPIGTDIAAPWKDQVNAQYAAGIIEWIPNASVKEESARATEVILTSRCLETAAVQLTPRNSLAQQFCETETTLPQEEQEEFGTPCGRLEMEYTALDALNGMPNGDIEKSGVSHSLMEEYMSLNDVSGACSSDVEKLNETIVAEDFYHEQHHSHANDGLDQEQHAAESCQFSLDGSGGVVATSPLKELLLQCHNVTKSPLKELLQSGTWQCPPSPVAAKQLQSGKENQTPPSVDSPTPNASANDFKVVQQAEVDCADDTEVFGTKIFVARDTDICGVECQDDHGMRSANGKAEDPMPPCSISDEVSFVFRHRIYFDDSTQQVECQVDWQDWKPLVISVKPGGEAECRGILAGDSIAFLNDTNSVSKTHDELLSTLQKRPLVLELDRRTHADPKHPHVEVLAEFNVPGDLGMDISWEDSLPVICAVRLGSAAWNEGILVGDAIHSVNDLGAAATRLSRIIALQQRPLQLTLWRRPLGADITAPWKDHLLAQSPTNVFVDEKQNALIAQPTMGSLIPFDRGGFLGLSWAFSDGIAFEHKQLSQPVSLDGSEEAAETFLIQPDTPPKSREDSDLSRTNKVEEHPPSPVAAEQQHKDESLQISLDGSEESTKTFLIQPDTPARPQANSDLSPAKTIKEHPSMPIAPEQRELVQRC